MEVGVFFTAGEGAVDIAEVASAAESLGFGSLWVGEHVVMPVEYERAALTDGCTAFGVWRRIVLPLSLPAMLVTVFLVTALSIGELACSHLLSPPGYSTVASRFFSLIHYGLVGDVAALSLISILGVSIPWLGLALLILLELVLELFLFEALLLQQHKLKLHIHQLLS